MKLITEINENIITEANIDGSGNYFIEGIFLQGNIKNKNGRKYPTEILAKEVLRYNREFVSKNRAYGELGHPEGPSINLDRSCILIKELVQKGDDFEGRAKVMGTPMGNIVKNIMDEGGVFGVSSRAMGSLRRVGDVNIVQNDLFIATAADIVADPSAPNAFVNGIMENKEYLWESNGNLKEYDINEYKKAIERIYREKKNNEKNLMTLFEDFMRRI